MKISVIIPAYNEEERIGSVLEAVSNSEKVNEIVVVNDGSTDKTLNVVADREEEINLLNLSSNTGKANALARGVEVAEYSHLLFLDADLVGLKPSHIDQMISVYEDGDWDMVLGVFYKGRLRTDLSQKMNPYLSGQRVLSVDLWNKLDKSKTEKFGVESELKDLADQEDLKVTKCKLEGVTHVMKEEKRGFVEGIKARLEMYKDIVKTKMKNLFKGA